MAYDADSGHASARAAGLTDGSAHTVVVSASTVSGNSAQVSFGFTVDATPPVLGGPEPTGTSADHTPAISVGVSDTESGVNPASITFELSNGSLANTVRASYDATTGRATYQVPTVPTGTKLGEFPLPDGTYTVTAAASDNVGNRSSTTWTFQVQSMPVT